MARIVYSNSLRQRLNFSTISRKLITQPKLLIALLGFNALLIGAVAWQWQPDQIWSFLPSASAHVKSEPTTVGMAKRNALVAAGKASALKLEESPSEKIGTEEADKMTKVALFIHRDYRIAREAADLIASEAFKAGDEYKIDPILMLAIIGQESRFNPIAESTVGAMGLTQSLPEAHPDKINKMSKGGHILNIADNIHLGARIFSEYYHKFDGNVVKALQQYNGSLDDHTHSYSRKVLRLKDKISSSIG